MASRRYQIELYYGYEECEDGIYHAFEADDPEDPADAEEMGERLALMLEVDSDNDRFNYSSMYINLPESLIARIKADAVEEYRSRELWEWRY